MGRKERVESALREHLAEMVAREVKDPRVQAAGIVGISRIECTSDLSVARVWVSIYGDDKVAARALAGLQGAAGFLRGPLGRRLNLSRPPELRFELDATAVMSRKLREIVEEDVVRAREAGRGPDEPAPAVATEAAADASLDVAPASAEAAAADASLDAAADGPPRDPDPAV